METKKSREIVKSGNNKSRVIKGGFQRVVWSSPISISTMSKSIRLNANSAEYIPSSRSYERDYRRQISSSSFSPPQQSHTLHTKIKKSQPSDFPKGSLPSPGHTQSKRRSQISLNHLLNFSLPPRQQDVPPIVSKKKKVGTVTPFNKHRYINAKYYPLM